MHCTHTYGLHTAVLGLRRLHVIGLGARCNCFQPVNEVETNACILCCCSLAVQTTLQPWSATIYHHILQYGLQPSITFVPLPEELCKATAIQQYSSSGGGGSTAVQSDSYGLGGYGVRAAQKSATTTYEAVRVHFGSELLLLGFIRSKQLVLNPAEGTLLVPGDVLVALSKRADGEKGCAGFRVWVWSWFLGLGFGV